MGQSRRGGEKRELIPFPDIAYQGFGGGMEEDAYAIRAMAAAEVPCFVSNSFSKIFSLYGERVGGLSVLCPTQHEAERVLGQLKAGVRRVYSSAPSYGAKLVSEVLNDTALKAQWLAEVDTMRSRIAEMRTVLVDTLKTHCRRKTLIIFCISAGCSVTLGSVRSRLPHCVSSMRCIWSVPGVSVWRGEPS